MQEGLDMKRLSNTYHHRYSERLNRVARYDLTKAYITIEYGYYHSKHPCVIHGPFPICQSILQCGGLGAYSCYHHMPYGFQAAVVCKRGRSEPFLVIMGENINVAEY